MPGLELFLFGGFGLSFEGERLPPIPSRISRAVLAYLVLYRDQAHSRERLAAQFWPDMPEARARRRLSHTLWQIQDALGELPVEDRYVEATGDDLRFNRQAPHVIDVDEFERRLERHRSGAGSTVGRRDLHRLEATLDLYAGDLLDGFDDDWVVLERERLAALHLDALGWMVELARNQGAHEQALVHARRMTLHDPLREDGHREVMRLSTLLGRTSEALRQYERCRSVLAEELGTEPARATQQLAEFIARQRGAPVGPTRQAVANPEHGDLRLVGRDRERATLVEALERTLAGSGSVSLVEGDAGVGKSRLVHQVVEDAQWRGFTVAHGACEVGAGLPYLSVGEAVSPLMTPVRIARLRPRVGDEWLAEVGRVVPRLAQADTRDRSGTPEEAAVRVREGFVRLLTGLADLEPTLLVVEDVHEADAETLHVLQWLAGRVPDHRLHLVLVYRGVDARARAEVWDTLRAVDAAATPNRVMLGPLTAFGTADLVRESEGGELDAALVARLHEETGGNPLFVLETIRALREQGQPSEEPSGDEDLPLPGSIRELTLGRVDTLPPSVREVLQVAAVQAVAVDLDTLQHATGAPFDGEPMDGATGDAVAVLLRRGLLAEVADGYVFRHEQVRRSVVDGLPADERRLLHSRVAAALAAHRPNRVEDIARHHDAAGELDLAVRAWQAAGDRATSLHAYATACTHYARAVELQARRPSSVDARIGLLTRYDDVLSVLSRHDRQEAVLQELAELTGADGSAAADVGRRRAWLAVYTDRYDDAERYAAGAVDLAEDHATRGAALTALGTARSWRGDHEEAVAALERAVTTHDDPSGAAEARVALGSSLRALGRFDEADDVLQAAAAAYDGQDDPHGVVRALGELAILSKEHGDLATAIDRYEDVLARCRGIGDRRREGVTLVNLGSALYGSNQVHAALQRYDEASGVFASIGSDRGRATVQLNAAIPRHEMLAEDVRAEDDVRAALRWFGQIGDGRATATGHRVLASIRLRAGDTTDARHHLDRAWPLGRDDRLVRTRLRRLRAALEVADGDLASAERDLTDALQDAEVTSLPSLVVLLLADRAQVRLVRDDLRGADADSRAAVERLDPSMGRAHLAWWARHRVARATGAADAPSALTSAVTSLDGALAGFSDTVVARAVRDVPAHAAITAAHDAHASQRVRVRLAGIDVPTGRRLVADDLRDVELVVPPEALEHATARRRAIPELVGQAEAQGAAPTVDDLAEVLRVSPATVRRDLTSLRSMGHDVPTRGARAG